LEVTCLRVKEGQLFTHGENGEIINGSSLELYVGRLRSTQFLFDKYQTIPQIIFTPHLLMEKLSGLVM
jgi:hypothetical protein